jgi:hypothetical protein
MNHCYDQEYEQDDLKTREEKTRDLFCSESIDVEMIPLVEIPKDKVILKSEAFWIGRQWLTLESGTFL